MRHGDAVVNRFKSLFWGGFSFIIGLLFGTLTFYTYDSVSFKPWSWKSDPIIINCYGEDLNELYIAEAVNYWILRGHYFGFIEQNPSKETCKNDYIRGFIMIKKQRLDHNVLGQTKRIVSMGDIVGGVIYFNAGSYRIDNVFIHELGHAIGYNHEELDGHIMHPTWDKMTDKFWIPE